MEGEQQRTADKPGDSSWNPALRANNASPRLASSSAIRVDADSRLLKPRSPSPIASDHVNDSHGMDLGAEEPVVDRGVDPEKTRILDRSDHPATSQVQDVESPSTPHRRRGSGELPDLGDLRDALSKSLASPGGTEMDESPTHQVGFAANQPSAEADSPQRSGSGDRSAFPSARPSQDRPTPDAGHASSTSFARTKSHDVPWSEDDATDPAWRFSKEDLHPRDFMSDTNRSNSFPEVPPNHAPPDSSLGPVTHDFQTEEPFGAVSQGGDVQDLFGMRPVEKPIQSLPVDHSTTLSGREEGGQDVHREFFPNYDDEISHPLGPSQGLGLSSPLDEEARYEEGVPLVPRAASPRQETARPAEPDSAGMTSTDPFGDVADTEDDVFASLANGTTESPQHEPHSLQRKSTSQVLGSLNMPAHHDTSDHHTSRPRQRSIDRTTGGGIAVSTATVISQVLGDASTVREPEEKKKVEQRDDEPEDRDLAELWKAALDDDEFLDDEEPITDPTGLFPDDGEGFLEDFDDQAPKEGLQSLSPSIPAAVLDGDGKMLGFNGLSTTHLGREPSQVLSQNSHAPLSAPYSQPQFGSNAQPAAQFTNQRADASRGQQSPYPTFAGAQQTPQVWNPMQANSSLKPEVSRAQSYADKSKGGYSSPYDLPMDVTRPKKRASMQHMARGFNSQNPQPPPTSLPPRSSSMYSTAIPETARSGPPPPPMPTSIMSPPLAGQPQAPPRGQPPPGVSSSSVPASRQTPNKSGFFEEIPLAVRPRQGGRYTPQPQSAASATPADMTTSRLDSQLAHQQNRPAPEAMLGQVSDPVRPLAAEQLRAPDRVNPYAIVPGPAQGGPPPSSTTSRYSPAPPPQGGPQGPARHANTPAGVTSPPSQPHLPRTSSPLAHHARSSQDLQPPLDFQVGGVQGHAAQYEPQSRSQIHQLSTERGVPPGANTPDAGSNQYRHQSLPNPYQPMPPTSLDQGQLSRYAPGRVSATPPPPRGALSLIASPPKRTTSAYQPGAGPPATEASFAPPRRSQTQSPGALAGLGFPLAPQEPHLRPASANNPASPPTTTNAYAPGNAIATGALPPAVSRSINYIVPNDGREADPFQRWKGCPIFSWGFGGTVVTTFPKEVQRYSSGQVLPLVKSSPGEVKTLSIKDFTPLEQHLSTFPGPLRSKGKKKEVVSWLEKLIEIRKSHSHIFPEGSSDGKIDEEKTLLCQVLRTLVEGDGVLDGTPEVQQAVRKLLSPGLQDDSGDLTSAYLVGGGHGGITQSATSRVHADAVDPGAVEQLRKALLAGDRESAVWQAVDKRLWAHAMLISSTLSRAVWKQVVQEFVRQEVKNIGENTESLSALYEVFAGNHEESIDELVPPSARAGFQLVSKTAEGGPTKDALQGLDKWRETLGLILSNRSTDDGQAIVALGRLLSGYGRVEAAHTCYMFARSYSYFGGVDDPQTSIALVGVNHLQRPFDYSRDLEAILLSEVYEFGLSLASSIPVNAVVPHLQAYKLHYAMVLADHGLRSNAQQYCEAIYGCIKSTTKPSPYYNGVLLTLLDDFTKRLQQSPKDGSTSWISKPTMGKISGSLVTKFNSFVVGDDSDAASAGSGKEGSVDVGPFAKVAGGTPTISRSPSNTDLYGSYGSGESYPSVGGRGPSPGDPARTSRYAPASVQAPRNGQDQPRSSLDANRSATDFQRGSLDSPRPAGHPSPLALSDGYVSSYAQGSDVPSSGQLPREGFAQSQQERYAPSQAASASIISPYRQGGSPYGPASHQPTPPPEAAAGYGVHESPAASDPRPQQARAQYEQQPSPYEPPGQEPAAVGYEPPSYAAPSYEPPSYEPYDADQQNGDLSPMDAKPKKKTFMDDDDDDFPKAPAKPPNQDKAAKDREAEENFRKAAEDDATKDKQSGDKKGWFGGWFGKKDPNAAPGPIRAKLGEESSFHYDPVLKKWINKKGGDTQSTASSGTPPPPRGGPPSRAVSGGPPTSLALSSTSVSRPPMSASTPNMHAPTSSPGLSSPLPQPSRSPSGAGTPPIPEYREPSTIAASLAPPGSGNASGPPSRPPSRPSTSMSTASSIDDLLGQPAARKGGTIKKGKKGRGYVDVMAK